DLRRNTSLLGIRLSIESSIAALFSAREPSRHRARANVCVRRDRESPAHHTGAIYGGLLHRRAGRRDRGNHPGLFSGHSQSTGHLDRVAAADAVSGDYPRYHSALGIGNSMIVAVTVYATMWPILINTVDGVRHIDRTL